MKNIIIILIAGLALVSFFFLRGGQEAATPTSEPTSTLTPESDPNLTVTPTPVSTPVSQVKEFSITAKRFVFIPDTITVNKGDTVRISITSIDVSHGFAISEFGVNTVLPPNETKTVEFVASEVGTYKMFCSVVCGSGHSDMKGTLIVQ